MGENITISVVSYLVVTILMILAVWLCVYTFTVILTFGKNLISQWFRRRAYSDYNRQLSTSELNWALDITDVVYSEVSQAKEPHKLFMTGLLVGCLLLLISFMLAFCCATMWAISMFHKEVNLTALSWYRIESEGGSVLIALFVGILSFGWLPGIFAMKRPVHNFKIYFWRYYENTRSFWQSISFDLMRKGLIGEDRAQDIITLSKRPYKQFSNFFGYCTVGLSALAVIFFIFDVHSKTVIYPDYIEHSPYFSLSAQHYAVQDITKVERTCKIVVRAKHQSRPKIILRYKLIMADGRKVPLFGIGEGAAMKLQIHAAEHWDNAVPKSLLSPLVISSTHPKEISPTKANCAAVGLRRCHGGCNDRLMRVFDLPTER